MSFAWTTENIETLRTLWAEGKSGTEIGMVLGVTRNAAIGKLHRLKVFRDGPPVRGARPQRRTRVNARRMEQQREWQRQRRAAERLEREPEHDHADIVKHRGFSDKNLAVRIKTKLRTNDGGPKYPPDAEPEHGGVSLVELGPNDCRWPHGDGPFTFCGAAKAFGSNYCHWHQALSRNSGSQKDFDRIAKRAMGGITGEGKSTVMET